MLIWTIYRQFLKRDLFDYDKETQIALVIQLQDTLFGPSKGSFQAAGSLRPPPMSWAILYRSQTKKSTPRRMGILQ